MQDRYVGDVGDYGKYALLRAICGSSLDEPELNLGVIWCLFPNESHNNDGGHISYLRKGHLRYLDPVLHDKLSQIVSSEERSVNAVAESGLLPANTVFFDELTCLINEDGRPAKPKLRIEHRANWLRRSSDATCKCDVVFFDPDNGLETKSINKRHPKAGKYIFWDEISEFIGRDQILVVYHHLNRTAPVQTQVEKMQKQFLHYSNMGQLVQPLIFRRGSCRVFWLVAPAIIKRAVRMKVERFFSKGWSEHFDMLE